MLFKFNYDEELSSALKIYLPCDASKLIVDQTIQQSAPILKERLPSMRGKLLQDNGIPHPEHLRVIDALDRTFLFNGYKEYFSALVPRNQIVISHNDSQENNILMDVIDNSKLTLIDYEYAGWNPMAFDLANYLNECSLDNAHPSKAGIALVPNDMSQAERADFLSHYLRQHYNRNPVCSWEEFISTELPVLDQQVKQCILLNHFFWAIWAFATLRDKDVCSEDVFNYAYVDMRVKQFKQHKAQFNL